MIRDIQRTLDQLALFICLVIVMFAAGSALLATFEGELDPEENRRYWKAVAFTVALFSFAIHGCFSVR